MSDQNVHPRQVSWRNQMSRYTVSVDMQIKNSFDTLDAAEAEAARIRSKFPEVSVAVTDSHAALIRELGHPAPDESSARVNLKA